MNFPNKLSGCFDEDGSINLKQWQLYRRRQRQQEEEYEEERRKGRIVLEQEQQEQEVRLKATNRRCSKNNLNVVRNEEGNLMVIEPRKSSWFISYIECPNVNNSKFNKKFRNRFRCNYDSFLELLELVKADTVFSRWQGDDARGRQSSPVELLLLGALRYLGRGWTFDDLEENTSISEEVHRIFFHTFIKWGSTVLFDKYVTYPSQAGDELEEHCKEMDMCGLHGCVASTDATHVTMNRCPILRSNEHTGKKQDLPSRTYNICVNHRRQILHTTRGHPARWNDKTLALFDGFLMKIKKGTLYNDNVFWLNEYNEEGVVVLKKYNGAWLLCDNGYQNWSTLIAPMKDALLFTEVRWSKWVESVRKDVECTFGIMKGRFRILKIGIRIHSIKSVDQLWCTCCALHNMFLINDGLNNNWYAGSISDWEGDLGLHNASDIDNIHFDYSGMGFGSDRVMDEDNSIEDDSTIQTILVDDNILNISFTNEKNEVRKLKYNDFRTKLIVHFDILFKRNEIVWPTRSGNAIPL